MLKVTFTTWNFKTRTVGRYASIDAAMKAAQRAAGSTDLALGELLTGYQGKDGVAWIRPA